MCIAPSGASRHGEPRPERCETPWEPMNVADFSIASPVSLVHSVWERNGLMMTRAGVTYVAMAAATISAGALGYAVIWSYDEPDAPPVVTHAPPVQELWPAARPEPAE